MSASWMLYASCVAAVLTLGATLLETAVRRRGRTTRVIWAVMLAAALIWPVAVAILGRASARVLVPVPVREGLARPPQTNASGLLAAPVPRLTPPVPLPTALATSPTLDRIAVRVVLLAPVVVLALLLLEFIRLARARRHWHRGLIDGVPVLVSVDFGPAIVGVVRPQIVIPAWALALPPAQRALMMAHESAHLTRHDNRWLAMAFVAVLLAPWNLGLWWLVSRFRLALEVDCDRRVLQAGHNLEQYGNLLIGIGRHDAGHSLLAAGFAERRTMLRSRIERMTATDGATSGAWRAMVGMALVVAACSLGPARAHQHASETAAGEARMADAVPAVSGVVPASVRELVNGLVPPTVGTPRIVTAFSRDTVSLGEPVELVTVTWIPQPLLEKLRRLPVVSIPLVSGLAGNGDQRLPITGGTRLETGAGYDLYVSWQAVPTSRGGRIEASGAELTYEGEQPGAMIFSSTNRMVFRSLPAVLIIRPGK
jgi:hypothetical protein